MSDRKELHRDMEGNAHFYASQAEWADKAIREKRAKNEDPDKPLYVLALAAFFVVIFNCFNLWVFVENSVRAAGFTRTVAGMSGVVSAVVLLILAIVGVVKAPRPVHKMAVAVAYVVVGVIVLTIF